MYGKTKLKLDSENCRDEKYITQTAWVKVRMKTVQTETLQSETI